jgi:hypothetical protein
MPVTKRDVSSLSKSGSAKLKGDVTLSEGANVTLTQSGNDISIASSGGSASPGGSDTQVQFNDGGALGGDAGLVYDKTTDKLTLAGVLAAGSTVELGHASDTTLSRSAAGTLAVEGVDVLTTSNTKTVTNKTLDQPILTGTPNAEAEMGYDSTLKAINSYTNAMEGQYVRVIARGVGTQSFINDTASDQDFTSLVTLPADVIYTNKCYRVTLMFEYTTGTSSVTLIQYLKLGSTKVATTNTANLPDGVSGRTFTIIYNIWGRAASGAAAAVSTSNVGDKGTPASINTTNQPVNLATNGTLAITPGLTFSGTGSTETIELQAWLVEEC